MNKLISFMFGEMNPFCDEPAPKVREICKKKEYAICSTEEVEKEKEPETENKIVREYRLLPAEEEAFKFMKIPNPFRKYYDMYPPCIKRSIENIANNK
ncbi:T3C protein [BeAn 58058 virus]|uniref:T3C protein n=1 Tax=BeAn 58058 virus TaxID=67082 RepID=UPI00090C7CF5|nr:T3C protein [BeAn 58058 virus]YP_009329805.1 T3C protein [BeAn 58058 virus]APG58203.1 T3C protein [BeAn 58058 virus]APG58390.1 T3C protein [BeAn 58058 virus]